MEDALAQTNSTITKTSTKVLILVLMEDALALLYEWGRNDIHCLNPCFNGRCTRTLFFAKCL